MAVVIQTGAFLLGLTLVINIIAFLVPYWSEEKGQTLSLVGATVGAGDVGRGLWGDCTCNWHLDDFQNYFNSKPPWFKSVQAMYALAIVAILVAVILMFLLGCCVEKGGSNLSIAVGVLLILACIFTGVAVTVFSILAIQDWGVGLPPAKPRLGWALWLAVVGAVFSLVTGIVHLHWGRRQP